MKATHYIEVYSWKKGGYTEQMRYPLSIETLEDQLAYTAKNNLVTVAVFKITPKQQS